MKYLLIILFAFQTGLYAATTTLSGLVVRVYDGDTLTLQTADGKERNILFAHIDAPEVNPKQDYGITARDALRSLVLNQHVVVEDLGDGGFGRTLGIVFLGASGGWTIGKYGQWMKRPSVFSRQININLQMVADGHAWHYKDYSKEQQYATAETRARVARIGLWATGNPTPPWVFRQQKKQQQGQQQGTSPLVMSKANNGVSLNQSSANQMNWMALSRIKLRAYRQ